MIEKSIIRGITSNPFNFDVLIIRTSCQKKTRNHIKQIKRKKDESKEVVKEKDVHLLKVTLP